MQRSAALTLRTDQTLWFRAAVRLPIGLGLLAMLFALRWDFGGPEYDFQAFRAAGELASNGLDPYHSATLNTELRSNPSTYGALWAEDTFGNYRMFFFNPPLWLTQLRAFGNSALVMSAIGGVAMVGAAVWMSIRQSSAHALGYAMGAFAFLALGTADSTMLFGQTGLLLAGIVGVLLVVLGTRPEGAMFALLAFKPHLAMAAVLPRLIAEPTRTTARVAVPLVALIAATALLYQPSLWVDWLRGLSSGERTVVFDDMTLRTLSPRHPLPEWTTWPLLAGAFAASSAMSIRWHRADIRLLVVASLGLTASASGHAFTHDYLWLVFVPIIASWRPAITIGIATIAALPHWSGTTRIAWDYVELTSLIALVAVGYLVFAVRASHVSNASIGSTDGVPCGEPTIDGEDRSGREHRLARR